MLLFQSKGAYRSLALCRPSPGLLFIISLEPALTRRPTELPPLKPGLRIRLATLAGNHSTNSYLSANFLIQNGNLAPPTVPPAGAGSLFFYSPYEWFRPRLRLRLHRLAIDMPPVARAHSFARLRLAGEAEFISRLVFCAQGAGGSLC